MARPENIKAELNKKCKQLESDIKNSLAERGMKYHAKSLELDAMQTRGHIINYVYEAIDDVKSSAFDYIDDNFCNTHGLPLLENLDNFSDAQALYVAMVVPELYPDIDDRLEKSPNIPELLFPALARDKLNKARVLIENGDFNQVELLVDEVEVISEMIVTARRYVNPEPYKLLKQSRLEREKSVSEIRLETVKKSSAYTFSKELRKYVNAYSLEVKSLLEKHNRLAESTDVLHYGVKGLDIHNFKDHDVFLVSLSNLAFNLESQYIEFDKKRVLEKTKKSEKSVKKDDDIFISLATVRRHLKEILNLK